MKPTPEQEARAAELAPLVAAAAGLRISGDHRTVCLDYQLNIWLPLQDPRAFQAVVLGLPVAVVGFAVVKVQDSEPDVYLPWDAIAEGFGVSMQYIMTAAGMLAFYSAVVELGVDE